MGAGHLGNRDVLHIELQDGKSARDTGGVRANEELHGCVESRGMSCETVDGCHGDAVQVQGSTDDWDKVINEAYIVASL